MDSEFAADLVARFPVRKKYLVGVSGGRDSVALLHLLHRSGYRNLVVCHFNHGLRGRASGEDARFVRRLADRGGLRCEIARQDAADISADRKGSLETLAREARYRFFSMMADRHRCRRLFLAHHADDQVETVLHHLFRGTGIPGLGGMDFESERPLDIGARPVKILRPLLGTWREQIDTYLSEHRLRWREDATNADSSQSTRNRWRHDLIPALSAALRRDPRQAIHRLGEIARAEDRALEDWLDRYWDSLTDDGGRTLKTSALLGWPTALQRRALIRWLREAGVPEIDFGLVERIRVILPAQAKIAKVNLPGGRHARRRAGLLFSEDPLSSPE